MISKYLDSNHRPNSKLDSRTDVKTLTFTSRSRFRGGKQTRERGRVQIWNPRRLECLRPNNSQGGDFPIPRKSVRTGSFALSITSSMARSFASSYTSSVMAETTTGFNFEMPSTPMLVFYLRADEPGKHEMSFWVSNVSFAHLKLRNLHADCL